MSVKEKGKFGVIEVQVFLRENLASRTFHVLSFLPNGIKELSSIF